MKRFFLLFICGFVVNFSCYAENNFNALAELTEIAGAPGFESGVLKVVAKQWKPSANTMKVDGMGNLIVQHKNNQQGPRVLLSAHMDEVGFMVESITDDGFLKVQRLGGIYNAVSFAQRWQVNTANGAVLAYSGMDSPHILVEREKGSPDLSSIFLDIGASSRQEAEQQYGIRPGLSVTPVSKFTALGQHRYVVKALDDRIGLALITDTLEHLKSQQQPNQLYFAATVQEEVGLRGASTLYNSVHPDVAINIEVGIADDYPQLQAKRKGRIALGAGPTIFVYDHSMIPNQKLVNWVIDLAKKNNIPVQLEVEPGYGEDGARIQVSGTGVPTINLGLPVRYAHQHSSVFDSRDYQQMQKLLALIVQNLNQSTVSQFQEKLS